MEMVDGFLLLVEVCVRFVSNDEIALHFAGGEGRELNSFRSNLTGLHDTC